MSYTRFGGDSDVYVFTSGAGIECCGCILRAPHVFQSNAEMLVHLERHRAAGHAVPEDAMEQLRDPEDAAENERIWADLAR